MCNKSYFDENVIFIKRLSQHWCPLYLKLRLTVPLMRIRPLSRFLIPITVARSMNYNVVRYCRVMSIPLSIDTIVRATLTLLFAAIWYVLPIQ